MTTWEEYNFSLDGYRSVDEKRFEISLGELAERYFSDPEICFIEVYDK